MADEVDLLSTGCLEHSVNEVGHESCRYDDVVVPFTNAFLDEPGVKNILVQDTCRDDHASHVNFTYDVNVYQMAVNALDPDHAQPVTCVFQPFIG